MMRQLCFILIIILLVSIAPLSASQAQTDQLVITPDNLAELKPFATLTSGFIQKYCPVCHMPMFSQWLMRWKFSFMI